MNKKELKKAFIIAESVDAKYIGIKKEVEENNSKSKEIVIYEREYFNNKLNKYTYQYTNDLVLMYPEKNKSVIIVGIAYGNTFEDIEYQLMDVGTGWKHLISDAIEKSYRKMIAETPPQTQEERLRCESIKESIKGMFLTASRSASEARFITANIKKYEEIFDICMNGDNIQFKNGLVELQRMQNEQMLKEEQDKWGNG